MHPAGWLSTYLSGYLHRDPSIGNILMTTKPVKRKVFKVPEKFLEQLEGKEFADETMALCEQVKQRVVELGITDECTGFIIDGDLAIPWEKCFSEEHQETKVVSYS